MLTYLPSASSHAPVEYIMSCHWSYYGRHYYCRYDYEGVTTEQGAEVMAKVSSGSIVDYEGVTTDQGAEVMAKVSSGSIVDIVDSG